MFKIDMLICSLRRRIRLAEAPVFFPVVGDTHLVEGPKRKLRLSFGDRPVGRRRSKRGISPDARAPAADD